MNNNAKEARVQEIKKYVQWKTKKMAENGHVRLFKTGFSIRLEGDFETLSYDTFASCDDLERSLKAVNTYILDCDRERHDAERHSDNASIEEMAENGFDIVDENTVVESHLEAEERSRALSDAIDQMSDKRDQDIVRAGLEEEKPSQRKIADRTGIPQKTVNNRCRKKIASYLKDRLKDY